LVVEVKGTVGVSSVFSGQVYVVWITVATTVVAISVQAWLEQDVMVWTVDVVLVIVYHEVEKADDDKDTMFDESFTVKEEAKEYFGESNAEGYEDMS